MKKFLFLLALSLVLNLWSAERHQNYHSHEPVEDVKGCGLVKESKLKLAKDLPKAVDNRLGLPQVCDQFNIGNAWDCSEINSLFWSIGYYYRTHLEYLEKGFDTQNPGNIISPHFIKNHIASKLAEVPGNLMYNIGSFEFMKTHGAATMGEYDKIINLGDYDIPSIFPDETVYQSALKNRIKDYYFFDLSSDSGFAQLKQHLANGNLAKTSIWAYDNFRIIEDYNNIYCLNETSGNPDGHGILLIGYDDEKVTSDGTGAFLTINSFGEDWGENGFAWISYEALKSPDIAKGQYALYAEDLNNYTPKITASLKLSCYNLFSLELKAKVKVGDDIVYEEEFFKQKNLNFPEKADNQIFILDLSDSYENLSHTDKDSVFIYVRELDNQAGGIIHSVKINNLQEGYIKVTENTEQQIPENGESVLIFAALNQSEIPSVDNFQVEQLVDSLIFSWTPIETAGFEDYTIYENDVELLKINEMEASSVIIPVTEYKTNSYYIIATTESGDSDPLNIEYFEIKTFPLNVRAGSDFDNLATLQWEKPDSYRVYEYQVERRVKGESEFSIIDSVEAEEYLDNTALNGIAYEYRLLAFNTSQDYQSCYSDLTEATPAENGQILRNFTNIPNPQIDGVISEDEWVTGTLLTANDTYNNYEINIFEKDNQLYLALYDKNDKTDNAFDNAEIFFDFNNNRIWDAGDGYLRIYYSNSTRIKYKTITGSYPDYDTGSSTSIDNAEAAISYNNGRIYEVKIDLENNLITIPEDKFGLAICFYNTNEKVSTGSFPINYLRFSNQAVCEFTRSSSVNIKENELNPVKTTLGNNYPNPFNPATSISYSLAEKADVKLAVYNAKGQLVQLLANGQKKAGNYRVNFNASNFNSGIYFYRLKLNNQVFQTKKMILVK